MKTLMISLILFLSMSVFAQQRWKVHDWSRPRPPVVTPGTCSTQQKPGVPPSDAIVLFDGHDLSQWRTMDGEPAKWALKDGYFETVKGAGYIRTYQNFGDCQLHLEFATPYPPRGKSQGRGNSGVFLMGRYEVQILDSYQNITYADGQCAAIYGQYPPLVNASRKPGQWQSYDIIFHGPRWDKAGNLIRKARMTVFHNGVLVHENAELWGPTDWLKAKPYKPHSDKGFLALQDHGNPVRFRNIWIREIGESAGQRKEVTVAKKLLDLYAGDYKIGNSLFKIRKEDGHLKAEAKKDYWVPLFAENDSLFYSKELELEVTFHVKKGKVTGITRQLTGSKSQGKKID